MKTGDKVALKLDLKLVPLNVSTPRGAQQMEFKRGDVFTLVSVNGENATVKDSEGNFWTVLMQFLGLVQEAATFDGNTTVNEGLNWFGRAIAWIGSIKIKNPFKKKK